MRSIRTQQISRPEGSRFHKKRFGEARIKRGPAERASKRVIRGSRSACASALADQERDLYDHLELGHSVVLHHALELLDPHGLDVADRLGCALDRLPDRVLEALGGQTRQFDEFHNRHHSLPTMLGPLWSAQPRW